MNTPQNIILTGFMGTGKTTVGNKLADRLDWTHVDTDEVIEEKAGCSIPDLFVIRGEEEFRRLESEVIEDVCRQQNRIITLGGGAVTVPENFQRLLHSGILICLRARPETILARIQHEQHRPLLKGGDRLERIRLLMKEREEIYARIPLSVDTDDLTPDQVADKIAEMVTPAS